MEEWMLALNAPLLAYRQLCHNCRALHSVQWELHCTLWHVYEELRGDEGKMWCVEC